MLPLILLLFVPAAVIASGLMAYALLSEEDYVDYHTDYDDHIYQMYEYYVEEDE